MKPGRWAAWIIVSREWSGVLPSGALNRGEISLALDAAHAARASWAATSVTERSNILLKIAELHLKGI